MILKDIIVGRSITRHKGGTLAVTFYIKPEFIEDLANRLVLESYYDEGTLLQLVITEMPTTKPKDDDGMAAGDVIAINDNQPQP